MLEGFELEEDIKFGDMSEEDYDAVDSQEEAEQAPVVRLCNLILLCFAVLCTSA